MSNTEKNGKYQTLVDHCFDLYGDIKKSTYRQQKIDDIKESYRVYEQQEKKEDKYWKGESKLELPLHAITVDNMEPRLAAALIAKTPYVNLELDGQNEQDEATQTIQEFYNDELENTVKIKKVAATVTHKAVMEGTVYPIAEYDEDDVVRRKYVYGQAQVQDPNTGQPIMVSTGQVEIDEDGEPRTEDVTDSIFKGGRVAFADFGDIFVPDKIEDWEKTDIIRVVTPTYGELMNKKDTKGYRNIDSDLLGEQVDKKEEENVSGEMGVLGKEIIECLECHVRFVIEKEGEEKKEDEITDWTEERYVATITKNTKTLIRILPLIDLNFKNQHLIKRIRLFAEEGKAYGTSMYEKIKSIQTGATNLYNQAINCVTISMIPFYFYTAQAGIEGERKLEPGKGYLVDDTSQILFTKFAQSGHTSIKFIEMFFSLWEKAGSISDIQMGQINNSSKDVTATETSIAVKEGNIKHNYQSISLKEDFIELLRTIYDLYYQHMPFDAYFKKHGKNIPIPRQAMERRYIFKIVGSTDLSNEMVSIQKAQGQYRELRQDPNANPVKLLTDVIVAGDSDVIPEEYVNPMVNQVLSVMEQNPQKFMQMVQQFVQQEQQAQAQQTQQADQAQKDRAAQIAGASAGQAIVQGGQPNA